MGCLGVLAGGILALTPRSTAAQSFALSPDDLADSNAVTRSMPRLAEEVLADYHDENRARYLDNAFRRIGFLVGTGATLAVLYTGGSTAPCDQNQNQDAASSAGCFGVMVAGAAVGAGLGAPLGGLIRTERWQDVPAERLRLAVVPQAGHRLGLGIALTF